MAAEGQDRATKMIRPMIVLQRTPWNPGGTLVMVLVRTPMTMLERALVRP